MVDARDFRRFSNWHYLVYKDSPFSSSTDTIRSARITKTIRLARITETFPSVRLLRLPLQLIYRDSLSNSSTGTPPQFVYRDSSFSSSTETPPPTRLWIPTDGISILQYFGESTSTFICNKIMKTYKMAPNDNPKRVNK